MLDRAYDVVDVSVSVATVLAPRGTAAWFEAPNPVFDRAAPRQLLKTIYGRRLVRDLVDALLAGPALKGWERLAPRLSSVIGD